MLLLLCFGLLGRSARLTVSPVFHCFSSGIPPLFHRFSSDLSGPKLLKEKLLQAKQPGLRKEKVYMRKERRRSSGSVNELIEEHLNWYRSRNYSPASIESFRRGLSHLTELLDSRNVKRVQDVRLDDLEAFRRYLIGREMAPGSVELYCRTARRFFDWLTDTQRIFVNPGAEFVIPRVKYNIRDVPSEEDVRRLLEAPDTNTAVGLRDRAIMETAYGTGARVSEVVGLEIGDVELQDGRVRLRGKGKERLVPLGRQACHWIKCYLHVARPTLLGERPAGRALWIGSYGKPLSDPAVRVQIRKHAASAGIPPPLSPHSLRRACATHMLRNGAHPEQIRVLLGHADLKTLSQYLQVSLKDLKAMHERSNPGK